MVLVQKPYSNGNNFFSPIHCPSLIKSVDWKVTDVTKFFLILEQVVPAVSSISVCCISQVHTLWRQAALPRYMLHQHHQMFFVVFCFFLYNRSKPSLPIIHTGKIFSWTTRLKCWNNRCQWMFLLSEFSISSNVLLECWLHTCWCDMYHQSSL